MAIVTNAREALGAFLTALSDRGMQYNPPIKVPTGDGWTHDRVETTTGELYHLKFTKTPYRPKASDKVSAGAKELDAKLKQAIRDFGQGDDTLVGLNDNVVLDLLEEARKGKVVDFVTVLGDGRILWSHIEDFYNFVMRYDTFIKFAVNSPPQAMVPTGWLLPWNKLRIEQPSVPSDIEWSAL